MKNVSTLYYRLSSGAANKDSISDRLIIASKENSRQLVFFENIFKSMVKKKFPVDDEFFKVKVLFSDKENRLVLIVNVLQDHLNIVSNLESDILRLLVNSIDELNLHKVFATVYLNERRVDV